MEKHINVVAGLHIGFSIFGLIIGIALFVVFHIIGEIANDYQADVVLSIIANVFMIFFAVVSIPGIIAGVGLLKRKEWARILTLIISVLDLFNFPLGTAVGVYSIWTLVQPETLLEFKKAKN